MKIEVNFVTGEVKASFNHHRIGNCVYKRLLVNKRHLDKVFINPRTRRVQFQVENRAMLQNRSNGQMTSAEMARMFQSQASNQQSPVPMARIMQAPTKHHQMRLNNNNLIPVGQASAKRIQELGEKHFGYETFYDK